MKTPVRSPFVTTEDPQISRFQSAVAAHVKKKLVAEGKPATPADMNAHPMSVAAGEHALAEEKGAVLPEPSDQDRQKRAYQPRDAQRVFHSAFPQRAPAGFEPLALSAAPAADSQASSSGGRSPADDNLGEWLKVFFENMVLVDGTGEPQYIDNGGDMNMGVIQWSLPDDAKVIVLGDWGSGNEDAIGLLADAIQQAGSRLAAMVHLGDVYYSGQPDECADNIQNAVTAAFKAAGKSPVPMFWVPGNHEYYSFGAGYYATNQLMSAGNKDAVQTTSYFALRTKSGSFQLLGMDTGRSDFIAGKGTVSGAPTVQLQPSEITWHQDKLKNFSGTTFLFSHHQLYSSAVTVTNSDTAWVNASLWAVFQPYFKNIAAWMWGHEHNQETFYPGMFGLSNGVLIGASAYEEATNNGGLKAVNGFVQTAGKPQLSPSDGYFNHGYAILDLKGDGGFPTLEYYTFPSWSQGQAPKDPKGTLVRTDTLKTPAQMGASAWPPAANLLRYVPQGMSTSHKFRLSVSPTGATGSWTVLDQAVQLAQTLDPSNIVFKGGKSGVYSLGIQIQNPTAGASPTCNVSISFQPNKGTAVSLENKAASLVETTQIDASGMGLSSSFQLNLSPGQINMAPVAGSATWFPNVLFSILTPSGSTVFLALEDQSLG